MDLQSRDRDRAARAAWEQRERGLSWQRVPPELNSRLGCFAGVDRSLTPHSYFVWSTVHCIPLFFS